MPVRLEYARVSRWLLVGLIVVQAVLLGSVAWDKSDIADEGLYASYGALLWNRQMTRFNCEATVLPKWVLGATFAAIDDDPSWAEGTRSRQAHFARATRALVSGGPDAWRQRLWLLRMTTVGVTLLGGLFLWLAARRFDPLAASIAHALWVFSPSILAHGMLAMHDAWGASAIALLLWLVVRFNAAPSLRGSIAIGVAIAVAAACKQSTLLAVPVIAAVGILALRRHRREQAAPWWRAYALPLLACAVAGFVTLWALYGFEVGSVTFRHLCGGTDDLRHFESDRVIGPIPLPSYVGGLLYLAWADELGMANYLFGQISMDGFPHYYLVLLAIHTTVGALLLGILACLIHVRGQERARLARIALALLAFPVALFVSASLTRRQFGIRYLLPAFAPTMLWCGLMVASARHTWRPAVTKLGIVLVLLGAIEGLLAHPHYLSFFNLLVGGNGGGYRHRIVTSMDDEQDMRRLAAWQADQKLDRIFLVPNESGALWGVRSDPPPCQPTVGTYALSWQIFLGYQNGCLDWLTIEPPDDLIGASLYLYRVDDARIERLGRLAREAKEPWLRDPRPCGVRQRGECSWHEREGHRWLLCTGARDWDAAEADCRSRGLHLAVMADRGESVALWRATSEVCTQPGWWIGRGRGRWVDGSPSDVDLFRPDTSTEDRALGCAISDQIGFWSALPCDLMLPYACEE